MDYVIATERLCLTEGRDRLVAEDDPEARWLFCIPGRLVPIGEAARLGMVPQPEPEPAPEPARKPGRPKGSRSKPKAS